MPGIEDARASDQTGGPAPRWRPLEPEARDLRLLRRARLAVVAAEALDLLEVTRVGLARQRPGTGKPELRGGEQRERRDVAPAGEGRVADDAGRASPLLEPGPVWATTALLASHVLTRPGER